MNFVLVATLKRGAVYPPERCTRAEQQTLNLIAESESLEARYERDAPMSIEEIWREQGKAAGYIGRRRKAVA